MSDTTLAEALRMLMTAESALDKLDPKTVWNDQMAKLYLRGHDDRQPEIDTLTARVRELEAENASMIAALARNARDEFAQGKTLPMECAKPAAVGVVGAVRWGRMDEDGAMAINSYEDRKVVEKKAMENTLYTRVVAIVDPDALVPLASGKAVRWRADSRETTWVERPSAVSVTTTTVTPLYPGLAQRAQEREG